MMNDNTSPDTPQPARAESPVMGMGDELHYRQTSNKNNMVLWGIFALLLVLTAGVFFLLPNFVQTPDPETVRVAVTTPAARAPAQEEGLSPFEEAQLMRQREAAQNTLAGLLELQEALDKKQVTRWAEADFNAALELARSGDVAYREQRFTEADALYLQGAQTLQDIVARETATYEALMGEGDTAIADGDAEAADNAYSLALMINPDSSEAVTGMERARVLNDVLMHLEEGRNLQSAGSLEEAREKYRQARELDPEHAEVQDALREIASAILERDFAAAMSRGYAALQAGNPDAARNAFEQAGALKPGSADVASALQQAEDQKTFAALSIHLEAARGSEAAEDWAAALTAWNEALAVDPNLVSALDGRRRSESRNNLDVFLEATIANPLRLAEEQVWNQTSQVLADARRIPDAGPKLQGQISQVQRFLELARVPATVQFQSDGMTEVTLYKVGSLGLFSSHSLSLTPGNYVAVGVRPGYRDVRQEFVVTIDGQAPVVAVACKDPV
jgi:tetratricopeptide (TPR) repeat protein